MNHVTIKGPPQGETKVKDLKEAAIVRWAGEFYVVVAYAYGQNSAGIDAVNLSTGSHLSGETIVSVLPKGTVVEIRVGG